MFKSIKPIGSLIVAFLSIVLFVSSCAKKSPGNGTPIDKPSSGGSGSGESDTIFASIPMDKFIGINGFHEDNVDDLSATGFLRAYCNWDWFQGDNPTDVLRFQYSRGGWYFDDAFKKIKAAGISTAMCFQGAPKGLQGGTDFKFNDKPLDAPGLNPTDPRSYQKIANTLYQIAARYGKTKVTSEKLNSDDKLSGLDLIEYIEVWNEPDKDWEGDNAQFSPEEYAAMLSICYDRIKEADPSMKVAMGGLATLSVDYVKRMKVWFDKNRSDKKFAAEVVNVHRYAFSNKIIWKETWPLVGPAETPEDGSLKKISRELVTYCKQNIPGSEVWISEFGWDTNPESVLTPKIIPNLSIQEVQARWIVRGYLEFAAGGIDRAQLFILTDPSQNHEGGFYATTGLIDRTLNQRKISWYYVYQMKTILTGLYFAGEVQTTNPDVRIYKFTNQEQNTTCYVAWLATSSNATTKAFELAINTSATEATLTQLKSDDISGISSKIAIKDKLVTIDLSEKPIFISVDK